MLHNGVARGQDDRGFRPSEREATVQLRRSVAVKPGQYGIWKALPFSTASSILGANYSQMGFLLTILLVKGLTNSKNEARSISFHNRKFDRRSGVQGRVSRIIPRIAGARW